MAKNILVLTGSPRKGGNSETLAAAFVQGAQSKGHEVIVFNAAANPIQGCRACEACWSQGEACVFPDGFRDLAPLIEKAEMLVFVTPVYWFGMTAQIKAAIDKFYSFMKPEGQERFRIRESALLMCAEDERQEAFAGLIATYKNICEFLEWQDKGIICVPNVNRSGDIIGNPALREAQSFGASL